MLGWFADSFRFAWALLYWNTRKSWFRLRRGRSPCPCQSPSDSGRAMETRCEACWDWHRPDRFRRVCPLLVQTPQGLRCSVDAADVRPFWGATVRYYGGTFLALYAAAVLAVFGLLRAVGYPVSIVHVALPPLWHRVGQARGWFYLMHAQAAFAAGRTNEGLLYLANSYEFDPTNYDAGLTLARTYQVGQAQRSDAIFWRLLHDHPERRNATAQQWLRPLLARGNFEQVAKLATSEVLHDPEHAAAWMRAAIFAERQNGDAEPLQQLLQNHTPAGVRWHRLVRVELARRQGNGPWLEALSREWPSDSPPYTYIYRVESLAALGNTKEALDFLEASRPALHDDEAYLTLRLDCLARAGAEAALRADVEAYLLGPPVNQPRLKVLCAQLIRHPDRRLFEEVCAKVDREAMPLNDNTAGGWFSLLCTAGAVGDTPMVHTLALRLRNASPTPFVALQIVETFFSPGASEKRATSFLPFLPVPLEVSYALIEKYPGTPAAAAPAAAP